VSSSTYQLCQSLDLGKLTDSRPALTPCRPVSQTSPSFSTSFRPEILIESQEYVCLEVSIQGIESAIAVKHDNSCPRIDAASAHQLGQYKAHARAHLYRPFRMYP